MGFELPYGIAELDPEVHVDPGPPRRVRCYVRGCQRMLRTPTRGFRGDVCPEHGIRCHRSSAGSTYVYSEPRRNIIVAREQFAREVVGHPFKYESHRLGAERSEDALTWNVFRSLYEAQQLHHLGETITCIPSRIEPELYLWGLEISENRLQPWPLLIAARKRFESNLPVERPMTEPDIALHLPGKYLILIEAKFTSANTFYTRGKRKNPSSLTLEELLAIYRDPGLQLLDFARADKSQRIYQQLWRNMVFAEWMAAAEHPATRAFHVNLVRDGNELESEIEFRNYLTAGNANRFQRRTWEETASSIQGISVLAVLAKYLHEKTAGLKPALRLTAPHRTL